MIRSPSSTASSPACALSPPEAPTEGAPRKNEGFPKAYQQYLADQGSARSPYQGQRPRKQNEQQQPDHKVNNDWRSGSYDSSNTSWESDWSASRGGTIKSESPNTTAFYKYRNNTGSYQSGTDWPGEPPLYGVMQSSQQSSSNSPSASSSSYYDANEYYGYGYDQNARSTPSGYQQYGSMSQQQQQYPAGSMSGSYNGNRNPSSCPPNLGKQQDYQRRQTRYGMDSVLRTQIKREPDPDGVEMEGENFTSLFTKSLTSLYSQDTENTYGDDSKTYDSDIMICNPSGSASPLEEGSYQRLGPPPGQYNTGYPNMRNNFGFYENRPPNCEPNVVQELGSAPDRSNAFRYDRPSFDDMHLYASSPPESKSQSKKRKLSMPNIPPEGGNYSSGDNRRKAPRMMSFKSDSKWTPNSFAFSDVQIKQEPMDEYTTEDLDSQSRNKQYKDGSGGNGNGGKNSGQQLEHSKPPPRKRSPGSTCFDRFEKKSTPTSKKVSPLSVYAKVQECVVLNVKCRRYKKRTKPINAKEEVTYPGKEEIENWKRSGAYSESPDQAVRHLMGDMLERVSQFSGRTVDTGPDLSQIDSMKVRELLFQFCQRYTLDYRDFEDIENVLKPNIVKDKTAKNSIRASAIRKRTSVSPVRTKLAPEPESKPPKTEKVSKKPITDMLKPAERRVLRRLPGRVDRGRQARRCNSKTTPVIQRRYSTRSAKDADDTNHSDVDIIIDSSTDRESEAGKEAEVRKKSQRLRNKQPVETPAKENTKPTTKTLRNTVKREEPRTRSREKREAEKLKDIAKATPKKKWSRLHSNNSDNSMSSSGDSVEIISSNSSSPKILANEPKISIKIEPLPPLKSLSLTKCSERISTKNSKQNEDASIKKSKSFEDFSCKNSKQTEESNSKNAKSAEETASKSSKLKEQSSNKNSSSKNEEMSNTRSSTRKLTIKSSSRPPTKKTHFILRRGKSSDIGPPIVIDEDSSQSKDDDESSSKADDKAPERIALKDSDMSSDESKDSTGEPKKDISENEIDSKSSDSTIKDTKQEDKESKVSEIVSKLTNDSTESISSKSSDKSSKSISIDKTKEVTSCREQKFDKPLKFSLFGDRNESTLQIKLNRLPIKLDSKRGFLPVENQDFMCTVSKPKPNIESSKISEKKNEDNSDLQNPPELVCMKEPEKVKAEEPKESKPSDEPPKPEEEIKTDEETCLPQLPSKENAESPSNLVVNLTEPTINTTENVPTNEKETLGKPCPIVRPRYSESEDSDCGLVIDLDRRLSVEERVPSPTFQKVDKKIEIKDSDATLDLVVKKEPVVSPSAETKIPENCDSNPPNDDCIILPPSEDSLRLDCGSARFLENTAKSFSLVDTDLEHAKKMKDQDESILRTLLLETADAASGVGHDLLSHNHCDAAGDISADSKASISQDVMKLLMYQTYHEVSPCCSSPGFDDKKIPIDQLTSDVNAQLLSDEECLRDPRLLKERIKKLKNEIVYLQCMIDQKDKERTAIICFKRYKEEVLKRVLKEYASNVQDHVRDWIRARQENSSSERSSSSSSSSTRQPSIASTSSSSHPPLPSDSPHPQLSPAHQVIQLAYHATVKTDVPTSTVTSASKKTSSCSESLPTVATMIAKATENYGVDMRTMRNGSSTTQTILQKVLSSKEAIYTPTACRSPSLEKSSTGKSTTHHQQQSVQIFQKTLSSTRESSFSPVHRRSPSLPELRPGVTKSSTPTHPQLLHKALSSKDSSPTSSRSPPSLQPELRPTKSSTSPSSSIQKQPLDLIVNNSDKLKMTSSKSYDSIPASSSKGSPETNTKHSSSPKRSSSTSYSAWSSIHSRTSLSATTTTTIDLRTDHTRTTQEPLPLSKRAHSSSHSSGGQGFMVVPPPTTLQQSQKSSVIHQSRSESSHPHEKSLKSSVERIYSRKTEEEMRTMSFTSSVMTTGNSLQFSHPHKSMSPNTTSNSSSSVGSSKAISQPSPAPTTSNPPRCMGCGLSQAKFLCSGCRSHWYCSPGCQSMRWPEHSKTCVGNIGVYNQSPGTSYS